MNNELTTDIEVKVSNTPAVVQVNFNELKSALEERLEKYRIVVTSETVADAKKLATELNKTAMYIDERRKEETDKASVDIKEFAHSMLELYNLCKDGRENILDQVRVFEDETRNKVFDLLTQTRSGFWYQFAITEEFRKAQIDDLCIISNLTPSCGLTNKARTAIELRVVQDLHLQTRTNERLAQLSVVSMKAGLNSVIRREQVANFLFSDSDDYWDTTLAVLVSAEIERQDIVERNHLLKIEREKKAKAEVKKEMERKMELAKPKPDNKPPAQNTNNKRKRTAHTITAIFIVTAPSNITSDIIMDITRSKLAEAGFHSIINIKVELS